jgi:uncharacterized membrane protein YuzA (DUF378 family)
MTPLARTALALVIIGALNWLLVGAFHFDLVAAIFGTMSVLSRVVYVVVGLAGIYSLVLLFAPASGSSRAVDYRRAA